MSRDTAAIRDQLGNDPDTTFFLNADYDETIGVEEGPTKVSKKTLGHVWIVGSSTNAIVGAWTGTEDGQQLVVGSGDDTTDGRDTTIERVVNPNNTFNEHFRDEDYIDTSNSTGALNTTEKSGIITVDTSQWGEVITLS